MPSRVLKLEESVANIVSNIERQFSKAATRIVGRLKQGFESELQELAVLMEVPQALADAGFKGQAQELDLLFATELVDVREELQAIATGKVVTYGGVEVATIKALIDSYSDGTYQTLLEHGIDVQAHLTRQKLLGQPFDISEFESEFTPRIVRNIKTELNTASLAFSRGVTIKKAEELGIDKFAYRGPHDKVTRDFCKSLIEKGRIFTLSEIKSMDNGQGLDVQQFGGGWNCRHRWVPTKTSRVTVK